MASRCRRNPNPGLPSDMLTAPQSLLRDRLLAALAVPPAADSSDYDLDNALPGVADLRPAGVLAAFDAAGQLLLTKRASSLRHHAGQIALPGGKVDPTDADATADGSETVANNAERTFHYGYFLSGCPLERAVVPLRETVNGRWSRERPGGRAPSWG